MAPHGPTGQIISPLTWRPRECALQIYVRTDSCGAETQRDLLCRWSERGLQISVPRPWWTADLTHCVTTERPTGHHFPFTVPRQRALFWEGLSLSLSQNKQSSNQYVAPLFSHAFKLETRQSQPLRSTKPHDWSWMEIGFYMYTIAVLLLGLGELYMKRALLKLLQKWDGDGAITAVTPVGIKRWKHLVYFVSLEWVAGHKMMYNDYTLICADASSALSLS